MYVFTITALKSSGCYPTYSVMNLLFSFLNFLHTRIHYDYDAMLTTALLLLAVQAQMLRACPTVTGGTCNSCSAYRTQDDGKCQDLDGGSAILTMEEYFIIIFIISYKTCLLLHVRD